MSVNPESGGTTTQAGIYFQNCITTLRLAKMLAQKEGQTDGISDGRIIAVRSEALAEVDDTIVTYSNNRIEYIQAKLSLPFHGDSWNKLWEHFYKQFNEESFQTEPTGVITLAAQWTEKLAQLDALLTRSRTSSSAAEWFKRLNNKQQAIIENIKVALDVAKFHPTADELFKFCRSIHVWLNHFAGDPRDVDYFEKETINELQTIVSNPANAFDALMTLTGKGARNRVQYVYDDLVTRLDQRGIRVLKKTHFFFNVPVLQNRYFVGRTTELDQIHSLFTEPHAGKPGPVGLSGMGGIGKTQIAVEYAYKHAQDNPDGVYWINGVEPLGNGFALIGKALRPETADKSIEEQISAAQTELNERPNSLVIIDNLRDPAELAQTAGANFIPASLPCRILITTRRFDSERFQPITVGELQDDDALKLLLRKPSRQPALDPAHPEHADAVLICALLGNLPLALEIAGAHLGQRPNQPLALYKQELIKRGALSLLETPRGLSANDSATRHDLAVAATLQSQWETLERSESRHLLKVASLLTEASSIPIARLALLSGLHRQTDNFFGTPVWDAVEELNATSLIKEAHGDHVRLHPLVRAFARRQIPDADFIAFCQQSIANLVGAYEELATLEQQAMDRGVDAIQDDLINTYSLVAQVSEPHPQTRSVTNRLLLLLRLFQREIHSLRGLDSKECVSTFIQQIHNRSLTLGLDQLVQAASLRLTELQTPHLRLRWRATRESPYLERTFIGHTGDINGVLMLPGERFIASASDDQTIRVWDLITGQLVRTVIAHEENVGTIALSPDGKFAASGSKPGFNSRIVDSEVKIWDTATWSESRRIETKTQNWPLQLLITPDSQRLIATCFSEHFVWNLHTGATVSSWKTGASVRALAVTSDGSKLFCGASTYDIGVFDVEKGEQIDSLDNDQGILYAIALTSDGRYLICGGDFGNISIWDLHQKELVNRFKAHDGLISCLKITADERQLISGSYDGTVKVWGLEVNQTEWQAVHVLAGHSEDITGIATTADGKLIASSSEDRTLKLWNLGHTGPVHETLEGHSSAVDAVFFVDDGKRAISVSRDGLFLEWNPQLGTCTRRIPTNTDMAGVQITPDGSYAIGIHEWALSYWRLRGEAGEIFKLPNRSPLNAVVMTATPSHAISAGWDEDRSVRVWHLWGEDATATKTLAAGSAGALSLLLTPDEQYIVYPWIPHIRVQNWRTGEVKHLLKHDGVWSIAITLDGKRLVAALDVASSESFVLQVWDFDSGEELNQVEVDGPPPSVIKVSPNGRTVFALANDYTLYVWDLTSGKRLATATLDGMFSCVTIAPDGNSLLVGDRAGNVYCLDYYGAYTDA